MSYVEGCELKFRMKNCGMSMKQLSDRVDIKYGTLSAYMNGYLNFPKEKYKAINDLLYKIECIDSVKESIEFVSGKCIPQTSFKRRVIDAGFTVRDIASKLDVPYSTLSSYFGGFNPFPQSVIDRIIEIITPFEKTDRYEEEHGSGTDAATIEWYIKSDECREIGDNQEMGYDQDDIYNEKNDFEPF